MKTYIVGLGRKHVKVGRNFRQSTVKNTKHFFNFQNCLANDLGEIKLAIHLELKIVQNC